MPLKFCSLLLIFGLLVSSDMNNVFGNNKDSGERHKPKHEKPDKDDDREKDKEKEKEKEKPDTAKPQPTSPAPEKEKKPKSRLKIFKESSKKEKKNEETQKESSREQNSSRQKREESVPDYYYDWEEDNDDDTWFIFEFIFDPFFADNLTYLRYPYRHNDSMYWQYAEHPSSNMALTFQTQYLRIDHNLWGYHLDNELRFPSGTTFELSYTKYIEDVVNQKENERMGWFKGYFNGYCLEDSNWNIKLGIGLVNLSSVSGGLGFQAGLDIFPGKPVGLHGNISYAFLSSGVDITDYELKLGLFSQRKEFTVGYRALVNSQGEDLSGPFLGVAWWF